MSLNVMKEYLKFNKKRLINYTKICLEKYYNKSIFENLLETYFNVRYYEIPDTLTTTIINKTLVKEAEILSKNYDIEDIKIILEYFPCIYYFDHFSKKDIDDLLLKINNFRAKTLSLEPLDSSLKKDIQEDEKKLEKYLNNFISKDFTLELEKTTTKSLFMTKLNHNLKIPKLYSDYAINNVYNRGLVSENKLFVSLYMISSLILKDIIDNKNNSYITDFTSSLIEKEDKLKRLFNIIDSNEIKNRVIFKITEKDFVNYKDNICTFIKNGYKFAIILEENSKLKNDTILKVFTYVLERKEMEV